MKRVMFSLLFITCVFSAFPQTASDYFPQEPGYKWKYDAVPLDSLNNPVDSLAFVQLDSFAVSSTFQGRSAEVVLSKSGPASLINLLPYIDTSYYDMENTNGWEYFRITGLDSLVSGLDSTLAVTFLELLQSFEDWYSVYRFVQNINSSYDIFSYDTTISYSGTDLLMRFKLEGIRLADQNLSTAIGDFTCKQFRLTSKIIYLFLGVIPITIVQMEDTHWIAPNHWILKKYSPATNVDLSFIGAGSFYIPGIKYDIAEQGVTGIAVSDLTPGSFVLFQNYPNPFNPSTKIKYHLPESNFTTLKIFDVLGNDVNTLINQVQSSGNYEITIDASNLPSGIYFYKLTSGSFSETKKMLLIK